MERGIRLARSSVWLCLLGSSLALGAFFLPYYTPPPASRIPHGSLWQVLVLMVFQQEYPQGSFGALSAGVLLLLLFSILVLAVFALVLRSLDEHNAVSAPEHPHVPLLRVRSADRSLFLLVWNHSGQCLPHR